MCFAREGGGEDRAAANAEWAWQEAAAAGGGNRELFLTTQGPEGR